MQSKRNSKENKLIFGIAVFTGIVLITILAKGKKPQNTLMNQALTLAFLENGWNKWELFWQCLWRRGMFFILLLLLIHTGMRRWIFRVLIAWIGAVFGMLLKLFYLWYGIKGFGLLVVSLLPQYFFYWMAYGLIYWEMEKSRISMRKNKGNLYLAIGVVIMGIFIESYVNPFLVSGYIKLFF